MTQSNQCPICLGPVRGDYLLECEHQFCTLCLLEMQESQPTRDELSCPTCRHPIPLIKPSPIYNLNIYSKNVNPPTNVSDHELQLISNHFETTFAKISWEQVRLSKYTVFHDVSEKRLLIGYVTSITDLEVVLSKCVCIERRDGRVYPTHPRDRTWRLDRTVDEMFQ